MFIFVVQLFQTNCNKFVVCYVYWNQNKTFRCKCHLNGDGSIWEFLQQICKSKLSSGRHIGNITCNLLFLLVRNYYVILSSYKTSKVYNGIPKGEKVSFFRSKTTCLILTFGIICRLFILLLYLCTFTSAIREIKFLNRLLQ